MKGYNIVGEKRLTDETYARLKKSAERMMGPMPKGTNRAKADYKRTLYRVMETMVCK